MKFLLFLLAATSLVAQTLLPSGWKLDPAGQQVAAGTFPISEAVSSNGKYLLVLNGGYDPPSIEVIDIANKREVGRTGLPDAWLGLAVAPGSHRVYVGGGSTGMVYELSLNPATGALARTRALAAVPDLNKKGASFIGDVALSASGRLLYAADLYGNKIAVIDLHSGKLLGRWKSGRRPYKILVAPGGGQIFVTCWADGSVYEYDTSNGSELSRTPVGAHPTAMLWLNEPPPPPPNQQSAGSRYTARLFVAASNTNNVYSFGVTGDHRLTMLEPISVSAAMLHALGMTPSSLAISPNHERLYVACSGSNAIAVVNIAGPGSHVVGLIPTGWYPTAVRVLPDGEIAILNGKGLRSFPNPKGPNPNQTLAPIHAGIPNAADMQYTPSMQQGTVAFLAAPDDNQLVEFTKTVLGDSPYQAEKAYGPPNARGAFFSQNEGHASPIQHVIYVIKSGRTYDQVLGDLGEGNGDQSLALFGASVTPNLHRLAREFIDYDNFYENSDSAADGQNWVSAAIAPDFTEKLWPNVWGHRSKVYDFEGGEPANTPPAGYVWDNALQAGISVRDYGEWVSDIPLASVKGARQIAHVNDPALAGDVDMNFRGFDPGYSDVDRAKEFIREWKRFAASGNAPRLLVVRLANDHTLGALRGALTPSAYVAQNDYATGMVVDAVSHSSLWPSTAIFIVEDNSSDGADHVDSHRAPAWVVSPYTRRGVVDSTRYNQMSMLRTVEMILGLRPMTQFDAAARPMFAGFSQKADMRPYTAVKPKVSLKEQNGSR
ncbi:MAG: alkaline phosphatase family protein [Bryobacteraceae bacterium]